MPRPTLARWMTWIAILAVNGALLRAFLVQEMFAGAILIFVALQLASWRWLRTRRRFWLGFLVGGVAAVLGLFVAEELQHPTINRWIMWYIETTYGLICSALPAGGPDFMETRWESILPVV